MTFTCFFFLDVFKFYLESPGKKMDPGLVSLIYQTPVVRGFFSHAAKCPLRLLGAYIVKLK